MKKISLPCSSWYSRLFNIFMNGIFKLWRCFFANNLNNRFLVKPVCLVESIGGSESIITCEAARAGHYVRNCQWKLSTYTALKLFNDNFSAGSRSCWLVREARTQRSKKYARRPREDDPANAAAIFYCILPEPCVPCFSTYSIRNAPFFFLTTYVHFFTPVANVNLICNGRAN